eukprot:scaffold179174_cov28-Tisochrysis_lutea.AAC.1
MDNTVEVGTSMPMSLLSKHPTSLPSIAAWTLLAAIAEELLRDHDAHHAEDGECQVKEAGGGVRAVDAPSHIAARGRGSERRRVAGGKQRARGGSRGAAEERGKDAGRWPFHFS